MVNMKSRSHAPTSAPKSTAPPARAARRKSGGTTLRDVTKMAGVSVITASRARIRCKASGETLSGVLSAREAVMTETPASLATSRNVVPPDLRRAARGGGAVDF